VAGRPRSAECDHAILDAALAEYAARGLEGMSVDAVAARAAVSKATIYRRYPSKEKLVVAAAFTIAEENAPALDTGSLRGDLIASLQNLRRLLTDPVLGPAKRMLLVDSLRNEELAVLHRSSVHERRQRIFAMLRRAIERGELQPDIDLDFAADTLGAPLFYRNLVLGEPIDDAYVEKAVNNFLARYGLVHDDRGVTTAPSVQNVRT